jgi:TIR domain
MAGKIFINYRRGDDPAFAGRLFDWLQGAFPPEQLFLDVDNIAPGLDFVHVLNERVAECDVVLAVIGKGWIDARNAAGERRLDDPDDFVRIEIASALGQHKRVIPVLVGEAAMPGPDELPEVLQPLSRRNAVRLTHERFRSDTQGLIKALQKTLTEIDEGRLGEAEVKARKRAAEERRLLQEAAVARLAEEKRKQQAEAEARERAAEERRLFQEAEMARLAEEKKRKQQVEAEARERAAEERRRIEEAEVARQAEEKVRAAAERARLDAAARRSAEEKRAFAAATRLNTVAAIDEVLTAYPASEFAGAAQKLKAMLLVREEAYHYATASTDAAVLTSFLQTYRQGADVEQIRKQLRLLAPSSARRSFGLGVGVAGALAVVVIAAVLFVRFEHESLSVEHLSPAAPANHPEPAEHASSASPSAVVSSPPTVALPDAAPKAPGEPASSVTERIAWDLVKGSKDSSQLQRFVDQFPDSSHRAEAEQMISALGSAALKASVASAPNPQELARSLQFELKRVGCFSGAVNGEFDDPTRNALHAFATRASITVTDDLSPDTIKAVRAIDRRVCSLVCPAGQRADGQQCIDIERPQKHITTATAPVRPAPAAAPAKKSGCANVPLARQTYSGC